MRPEAEIDGVVDARPTNPRSDGRPLCSRSTRGGRPVGRQCAHPVHARLHRPQQRGLAPTLGSVVAHEGHDRGDVLLTLEQCGHALDEDARHVIRDRSHV